MTVFLLDPSILGELLTPTRIIIMLLGCAPLFTGYIMYFRSGGQPYAQHQAIITILLGGVFAAIVFIIVFGVFYMTNMHNQ